MKRLRLSYPIVTGILINLIILDVFVHLEKKRFSFNNKKTNGNSCAILLFGYNSFHLVIFYIKSLCNIMTSFFMVHNEFASVPFIAEFGID